MKTKHAAYLVYAVRVTLEGEETNEQKIPALLTTRTQAGMTESASTRRQPVFFTSPFFFQPSLYSPISLYMTLKSDRGLVKAVHPSG